ncbi:hypothetical protein L218DRAFT_620215 [Marasmius fiardii PR-910]|nr:hypothetical protein L218DRAFT_620215 [Marasmius fiardii PR-910]
MSSLTLMRPPKYFSLYQRLLGSEENLLRTGGMQLESLSGCPDEAWLAIVEVSVLAFWKVTEERKGSLSVRELVRRGDDIERRLRSTAIRSRESFQTERPLSQNLSLEDVKVTSSVHQLVTALFRETALLYLHSMTSPSLGAYEITTSVDIIVELLRQIPSGIDRTLVFPICLVGCMTDDPNHRAFLKWRLQAQDETIGNILNVKFLIEQIWQRRRDSTAHVDWRELLSPRSLNLLLI